jgi:hypothetical protein
MFVKNKLRISYYTMKCYINEILSKIRYIKEIQYNEGKLIIGYDNPFQNPIQDFTYVPNEKVFM